MLGSRLADLSAIATETTPDYPILPWVNVVKIGGPGVLRGEFTQAWHGRVRTPWEDDRRVRKAAVVDQGRIGQHGGAERGEVFGGGGERICRVGDHKVQQRRCGWEPELG